jgi:hypothetical protein
MNRKLRPLARRRTPTSFCLGAATTVVLLAAALAAPGAQALIGNESSAPTAGDVSFNSVPSLFPNFGPNIYDYVVRCNDGPVTVNAHASAGWEAAIGSHPFRSGDFSEVVPLSAGRAFTIRVRDVGRTQLYRYHVRCLPNDFPKYTFQRYGPVSPKYFAVDPPVDPGQYATIFDNHGVPLWWDHTQAFATRVLLSGNLLWCSSHTWAFHRLDGSVIRTLPGVGINTDHHDLQLHGNDNYLVGAYVPQSHVDTRPYGSSDATVQNIELQEVSRDGRLVWRWKSQNHISLSETAPRFWPTEQPARGYDILHWNSVEPAGNSVIASFRHLDAVYKIDQSTHRIVWKLGGTSTPRSLNVTNDPYPYTFGGQHDARLLPDGTLSVFDNRFGVSGPPRAVRYRIDEQARTATLVESISDPAVQEAVCCGSARRLANGDWLINWGSTKVVGGYKPDGQVTFRLTFERTSSYRAEPVPDGVLSPQDLRQAMNAMYATP